MIFVRRGITVLLEKQTGSQLVKKFPLFYGNRKFITIFTVPATCPCPEPDRSGPCPTSHFLKIHLNIILPSTPGSSKWFLSLRFPHRKRVYHDKWVPITTAWRVLRLRMDKRPSVWRVSAKRLNKQSRIADKCWSSSLGIGRGVTTPHRKNLSCYESFTRASELDWSIIIIISHISSLYKVLVTCINHAVPRFIL